MRGLKLQQRLSDARHSFRNRVVGRLAALELAIDDLDDIRKRVGLADEACPGQGLLDVLDHRERVRALKIA